MWTTARRAEKAGASTAWLREQLGVASRNRSGKGRVDLAAPVQVQTLCHAESLCDKKQCVEGVEAAVNGLLLLLAQVVEKKQLSCSVMRGICVDGVSKGEIKVALLLIKRDWR